MHEEKCVCYIKVMVTERAYMFKKRLIPSAICSELFIPWQPNLV